LSRHSGTVRALAVGHGGELLASGGDDGTVRVWDVGTGSPQRTIPGHSGGVRALAAAPNDAWLFAGDAAGTLRSWDSHNWGQRFVSNTGAGEVRALAMTPDGTRLACAGDGEMVRIYDAATGDMLAALAIPTGGVRALAVTPDGTRLACAGADGRIALRVLDVGERRTPAPASSEAESSVTQVPDGVVFTAEIAGRRITLNLPAEIAEANSGLPAEMEPPTSSDADALLDVQTEITLNTFEGGGQVVAVDGPPGSGKTQLAVHAARIARARGRFPGGVLFASLAGQGSIGDALTELLRALGLPAELIPGRTRDKEPLYRSVLAAYAQAGRRILVVIDDASVREQVIPMLPSDESTCVIVTSRSQLSIPDTTRLGLPPSGFQAGEPEFLPAPDLPPGPRNALVIATSHYVDPNLRQLRSPVHDADRFAAVLGDPAIGGFEVSQLHDRNSSAIRLEIARFLAGRAADETVLVYLSCHGTLDTRGRLMFAATDTDLQYPSATAIAASYLLERLDDCRARRQILILDCSFSGAFGGSEEGPARESSSSSTESGYGPAGESSGSGYGPAGESSGSGDAPRGERESGRKDAFDLGLQLGGYSHGREVLTASRSFEYTFEGEPLNDESTGSVFTTGLVEGLRTGAADAEGNGRITVQEAYDYAFRYVRQAGVPQTPQRWLSGAEGEPIVLARSVAGRSVIPAELPERMTTALESPYQDVRIGGINTIAEWLADPDPARRLAARRTLEEIAENDGPRVAAVASAHLNRI
jgi:hypothetical protein